jgi:hypothetical protein
MTKLFRESVTHRLAMGFAALALTVFLSPETLAGSTFSFTGSFAADNDVQLFTFTISSPTTVNMETWSYAGGTNAAGTVIPAGGFDPFVTLFSSNGHFINDNDDGATAKVDPTTGVAYDSQLSQALAAGKYIVALTQFDNFANKPNLTNGFSEGGNTNFTLAFAPGGSTGFFWDLDGNQRTSKWALDIDVVNSAVLGGSVPEPSSLILGGIGGLTLVGFTLLRRRRPSSAT